MLRYYVQRSFISDFVVYATRVLFDNFLFMLGMCVMRAFWS